MNNPSLVAASRLFRCPLDNRAIVVFDPTALAHRARSAQGWWLVREQLLPEMAAARLALFVCGPGDMTDVEVEEGMAPDATGVRKRFRFPLEAPSGRVYIGPASSLPWLFRPEGETDEWGGFVELLPGQYALEVELMPDATYRMRFVAAADLPAPPLDVPNLGPGPEAWDRFVVRDAATDELLSAGAAAFSPHQRGFLSRVSGHDRFDVDQDSGLIVLHRGDEMIMRAPFHAIGSYGVTTGTWRWAWANETIAEPLRERVLAVLAEGEARDMAWLTEESMPIPLADAGRLAALSAALMGLDGWYCAAYEEGLLFVAVDDRAAAYTGRAVAVA